MAVAGAACALLALTACSSSSGGSPSTSAPASQGAAQIVIKNFSFSPASLSVAPGTVVTVKNEDQTAHTATATGAKAFDTGTIAGGRTATFKAPTTAGTYDYICNIHPYMKGKLTVG